MTQSEVIGKTVERVEYDYYDALRLHFTDGSMLFVQGVWHNDDTAGTAVALLGPEDPKSYSEDKLFYQLLREREWK